MVKIHGTEKIIQKTFELGVSDVHTISAEAIPIEAHLAKLCEEPKCDGYGQSANCPPYGMKSGQFREYVKQYKHAVVFKFDVPTEVLLSEERREVSRLVHETASAIEKFAINDGYAKAKGLAAGSCKRLFCGEYEKCGVLTRDGDCRFPDLAKPSMSGLGINFFELSRLLGWQISKITKESNPDDVPMGLMAGMVLIG
ncbi:DUF2284 domain-containing protein [Desulfobacterales bacterium HSG2]|nr:DUF2284 domain-containing protein [Desulfobacterales bacterium HSG2]